MNTGGPLARLVADRIRSIQDREGLSNREFAARIGVTHPYVGERYSYERDFTLDDVDRVAQEFSVPPEYLLGIGEPETTLAPALGPSGLPFEGRVSHIDIPEHLLAAKGYAPGENPDDFDYDNIP